MVDKHIKLGTLLVQYGLISEEDLDDGLKLQKLMGLRLGETLVKIGKLTEENVQWVLSKQYDIPFIIIEHVNLDKDLIMKLPKNFLLENRILPLFETDEEVSIVTEDILNYTAFSFIEGVFNKKVSISIGEGKKIEEVLNRFFNQDAMPSLLSVLEVLVKKIKDTFFYRIDIVISNYMCEISVYGCGILKKITTINSSLKKEDVLRTFDLLKIPFLYEIHENYSKVIFCIYPISTFVSELQYPSIIGGYGLAMTNFLVFSDTRSSDISNLIYSEEPVYGYPYLALKKRNIQYDKVIYTPDSFQGGFYKFFVKMFLPRKCNFCKSVGCSECDELGYFSERLEGLYTDQEIRDFLSMRGNNE
ncbi:MAG: hypothetical protein N3A59_04910 [Thermodesulfovibrionales bacterium]|nr:hypothetical protein [Thermodesulfovibrionales bacterium]